MTQRNRRRGKALRALLVVLLFLISVPAVMIGAWRVSSAVADDNRRQRIQAVAVPIETAVPQQLPDSGVQYRPVIETEYREKTVTMNVPEFDPDTGETVVRERQQVVRYPVQTQRWVKSYTTTSGSPHSQEIMQLAGELREMKEDDESRDAKLSKLRTRLELEFSQLHENQSDEIERTEKRLESLRRGHQQRGENKDKIVQRRIDELLGKADPLGWNNSPLISQSTPSTSGVGQSPINLAPTFNRGSGSPTLAPRVALPTGPRYGYSATTLPRPPRIAYSNTYSSQLGPLRQTLPIPDRTNPLPGQLFPSTQYVGSPDTGAGDAGTPDTDASDRSEPAGKIEPAAESANHQSEPLPATAQLRVGAPRSALSEVFYLARSKSDANAELAEAEYKYQRYKELRDKGAIPIFEFKQAESEYAKCKREVKLIDMQLEAFSEAMKRVKDVAKATHERALSNQAAIQSGIRRGNNSQRELVDAKYEVEKSQIELADASENIRKLNETMEAVKAFDKQETDPTVPVESVNSGESSEAEAP